MNAVEGVKKKRGKWRKKDSLWEEHEDIEGKSSNRKEKKRIAHQE